jgi:hypothetical protein
MPRIRLPKDLKYRVTRVLSHLKKPGVGVVCFWCSHQYRIGEYSRATESDHLLQCPEFPHDGKRRMQKHKGKKTGPPTKWSNSLTQDMSLDCSRTSENAIPSQQASEPAHRPPLFRPPDYAE